MTCSNCGRDMILEDDGDRYTDYTCVNINCEKKSIVPYTMKENDIYENVNKAMTNVNQDK